MEPGFSRRLLVVVVLSMLLTASVSVFAQSDAPKANSVRWLTYVDPRFDFSIKYPSDWQVIQRDDRDPEAMSGLLKFVPSVASEVAGLTDSSDDPQGSGAQVVVGLYLAELEAGQSLSEWTDLYESLGYDSDEALVQRRPRKVIRVKGVTAVHEEGVSLVTPYQFTNLTHGRTVWFIWTNIPSGSEAPDSSVYRKMVRSFRFGKNAPSTLQEVYGFDFEPLNLEQPVSEDVIPDGDSFIANLTSSWLSPVLSRANGTRWNVQCGSNQHTGTSDYAADIGVGVGNKVYSAKAGIVTFAGQHNTTYGNLIKIKASGGKEAFYAHLSSIYVSPGAYVSSPSQIALSGNSGGVDAHLHFHVRNGSNPENLVGMLGFYPKANWPTDNDESCAEMGR